MSSPPDIAEKEAHGSENSNHVSKHDFSSPSLCACSALDVFSVPFINLSFSLVKFLRKFLFAAAVPITIIIVTHSVVLLRKALFQRKINRRCDDISFHSTDTIVNMKRSRSEERGNRKNRVFMRQMSVCVGSLFLDQLRGALMAFKLPLFRNFHPNIIIKD